MPGQTPLQAGKADSGRNGDSGRIVRTTSGTGRSGRLFLACSGPVILAADVAQAQIQAQDRLAANLFSFGTAEVMQISMLVGVMGAALLSAIVMIRERARTAVENAALRARVAELHDALVAQIEQSLGPADRIVVAGSSLAGEGR